ncbi:50S ribosomal protein L29 [Alcanivorax sp. HI0083]|jgi:large subunit ribosomal protein L29|uniref:50S ribosomal protein L29 n=1 Tax=unclassified Alcanivorax TaxID=2638842 RepID=UPI00017EDE40|nr:MULTISPECIES: 50S ribosomal protein L29 [unclassified Alcanivorax]EDX90236.1 ribosomal protein L29 [Alcanivorax sp. DG881]KZY33152.1 50S ribosomal protein L29 [Alcanivorax sp. HI0044]KZZ24217.1 50S ribosomal protein L29 [Alcanivorax sp. HI0083]MTT52239.1 50S ribosomal protein L29 [Alcanivorax sp. VBW004]PHR65681.1 MAG: 50S ribosomal protein L29 [Alcanivorax sp.]|tara:strand:- start:396 stop:587 length:192 start_codon:yes stop_codon:yes gene_type:complete
MKASELKDKSVEELQQTQIELLEEQFKLRMKSASGQISKTHELGKVRRNIARVKTILREKQGN